MNLHPGGAIEMTSLLTDNNQKNQQLRLVDSCCQQLKQIKKDIKKKNEKEIACNAN